MPDNTLPSNLSYGTVTGRFLIAYADGIDLDDYPDGIAASGSIFFTSSPNSIKNATATPAPVTIIPTVIECSLNNEGYLTGPDGTAGVRLLATDDTDGSPTDWYWTVSYQLFDPSGVPTRRIPTHTIQVPSGATVDLTINGA